MNRHAVGTGSDLTRGLSDIAARLRTAALTPLDLFAASRRRIAEADGDVGAFTWLNPWAEDDAAVLTQELADGRDRGPLHGIPIGVKELFDVAGAPSAYGSNVLPGDPALADAAVVRRLRDAGAVVVGTTRSHEFGWGITTQHQWRGSTRNPWDLDRVPGGSSGGSAAAVAAGMVPFAVASDTGGSIRIPAVFCGVAGIKPSYGRISKSGAVPLAPSLDTVGFVARSVADLVEPLRAVAGADPDDPTTVIAGLADLEVAESLSGSPDGGLAGVRIGHSPDLFELSIQTDRTADYERALAGARALGAELVELALPRAAEFRAAFGTIQMADALHVHRSLLATYPDRADRYGADVRSRLEAAAGVGIADLLNAITRARQLHAQLLTGMRGVHALLSPIATVAPPRVDDPDNVLVGDAVIALREAVMGFTTPQNLTGLPTVAFPFGSSADGLPVGFQITTTKGHEIQALRIASLLEQPPVHPHATDEREN